MLILLSSCASSKAKYELVPVALEDMVWRRCKAVTDGEKYALKGECFIAKECKKRFWKKDKCRKKVLFCAWGDIECMLKWNTLDSYIKKSR